MLTSKPKALRDRYGKAHGARLTAEDRADLELAQEGLRQLQEHPETMIPAAEVKRLLGLK
jgi:hypothetical protein